MKKKINDAIDFKVPMKNVKTTHAAQNKIRCVLGASNLHGKKHGSERPSE